MDNIGPAQKINVALGAIGYTANNLNSISLYSVIIFNDDKAKASMEQHQQKLLEVAEKLSAIADDLAGYIDAGDMTNERDIALLSPMFDALYDRADNEITDGQN